MARSRRVYVVLDPWAAVNGVFTNKGDCQGWIAASVPVGELPGWRVDAYWDGWPAEGKSTYTAIEFGTL